MWVQRTVFFCLFLKLCSSEGCQGGTIPDGGAFLPQGDCIAFNYDDKNYEANHCRYDYLHNQSWCQVHSEEAASFAWGICQGPSCQPDFKQCTFGNREEDGKIYFMSQINMKFEDARNECEAQGCRLAHADNDETYQIIKSYLDKNLWINDNRQMFWIGISYNAAHDVYWIANQEKFTFDHIYQSNKDCAILKLDRPAQLGKGIQINNCQNERQFLCQCESDDCPSYNLQSAGEYHLILNFLPVSFVCFNARQIL